MMSSIARATRKFSGILTHATSPVKIRRHSHQSKRGDRMRMPVGLSVALTWAVLSSMSCGASPKVKLMPWLKGLEKPVQLTHDGTERIFIVEQPGRVRLYQNGQLQRKPYLDLSSKIHVEYECGVLSI